MKRNKKKTKQGNQFQNIIQKNGKFQTKKKKSQHFHDFKD